MTLLQWKGELRVCIDPVDRDHREPIDLVNRLHEELNSAAASLDPASIGELLRSISAHLGLEETMVQDEACGDLALHKAEHERLIDQLCDLIVMHALEHPEEVERMELAWRLDSWCSNRFRTHRATAELG